MRTRGGRRGCHTHRTALRVAPTQRGVGYRSGTVARGVDHVVRSVGECRNRLPVADLLLGGVVVRDVEAETARLVHPDRVEPLGHHLRADPARVPAVDVQHRRRIPGERVDGVADQVETFLTLIGREAIGHRQGIGFEDDGRRQVAQTGGDGVDPPPVAGGGGEPARGEAPAVAVRDRVERQDRHRPSRLRCAGVSRHGAGDRGCRECVVEPVRLRGVGDGGQLGARRVGVLGRRHCPRDRIDVEGPAGQRVGIGAQAHRRRGSGLCEHCRATQSGNNDNRQDNRQQVGRPPGNGAQR